MTSAEGIGSTASISAGRTPAIVSAPVATAPRSAEAMFRPGEFLQLRAGQASSRLAASAIVRIHIFQPAYCFQWLAGALCELVGRGRARREIDMLGWFRKLLPREDRFFDLFERHSRTVV